MVQINTAPITHTSYNGEMEESIWKKGNVVHNQEGDSNRVPKYLVGTSRGNQGGATRTTVVKCEDRNPREDKADGGYLHTEEHRLLHMGNRGEEQAPGWNRHCVAEGEGLEDQRYGVLHPARGKFYVDNGVEEVVRSRGVHKYQ